MGVENYVVTIWDKRVNEPYHSMRYEDKETAQYVARRMKIHYVDEWGEHGASIYEIRLQKARKEQT